MHQPRKRFGQNFLVSEEVLQKLVQSLHLQKNDRVVEIGPGKGALTERLLALVDDLTAIEIDRDLVNFLQKKFSQSKNFHLISGDVLKVDWLSLAKNQLHYLRVVGNLPYNISSPLLFQLSAAKNQIQDIHVMLQREVADRLCAKPGNRDYGRLSVMLQYDFYITKHFDIPPQAFNPSPQVYSSWVSLLPRYDLPVVDREKFEQIVRAAFNQRRKTVRNSLKGLISSEALQRLKMDTQLRAESLDIMDYVRLCALS